ncbi:MAG: hypothetical protein NW220_11470 [Leptolyngbyaceae cyanobacterium bins.349]|nr:hypothetical protein [Leptolyngbyaceae cyanobacterium bins.349]
MSEPSPQEYLIQNREALEELVWAIDSSAGTFALLLARCNYARLREQLVADLQHRFPDLRVLTLPPDTTTLFATIRDELGGVLPTALMVFGLESVTALDQLLSSTNQVREEFRKSFLFPLVFWVTDDTLQKLSRLAPDFESWATTTDFTFDTATLTRSLQEGADHLFETLLTPDSNLSFNRLLRQLNFGQLRLAELDAALQELQQREQGLAPDIQASLEFFQGVMNADRTAAIDSFHRSLTFWEAQMQTAKEAEPNGSKPRISPNLKAGLLHFYIGQFLYYRVYRDDERSTDWETTRQSLSQAIALFDQANRPDLVAKCTVHLQRVLEHIGAWAELETLAQRSLTLHQTYGTPSRIAQDYRFLAIVAMQRQNWTAACEFARQAWDWLAQVPEDQHWQGLYLLTRAKAQLGLGDFDGATSSLEEAHQLGDQGHPQVYTEVLEMLRQIYRSRHDYLDAFRLKQERQSVEQQYGIRAFVGAGRLQPKREDREALEQPLQLVTPEDEIALEIRASGRQQDLEELLRRIGRNDYKLIVIHGYSGVGKSSLVNGGLVAALKQKLIGTRPNLPIVVRTYTNWEQELQRLLEEATAGWAGGAGGENILEILRRVEGQNRRSILIFDQFEEFFFVYPQPEQRRSFFRFLAECLLIPSLNVVLSLREDYLHFLLECHQLPEMDRSGIDVLSRNVRYGLGNFAPMDAAAIIDNLTNRARFYLEPELRDALVADLAGELGQVRPIELQIVGAQLQADNMTTLSQYRQLGNNPKQMLVERYLAEVVNDCGEEHDQLTERVLYLLTDEKGTRPLKPRTELEKELPTLAMQPEPEQLSLVLEILVGSGLVMLLPEVPEDRYQLVHDYLAAFIREQQEPLLTAQLREAQEKQRQAELREQQAQAELQRAKDEAKQELATAQQNKEQVEQELTVAKQNFADVSRKAKQRERVGVGVLVTSLGLSLVAGLGAMRSIQSATEARQGTRLERAGVVALDQSKFQQTEALLTALQTAIELKSSTGKGKALQDYLAASPLLAIQTILDSKQETRLEGHQGSVLSVVFSPDGSKLATSGEDGTARIWDTSGKQLAELKGHQGSVLSVVFSPDGSKLATSGDDGTARIWDTSGKQLAELKGHQGSVWSVVFSPDGSKLATSGADGTARIWDTSGKQLAELKGHQGLVWSVVFSPDGSKLATSGDDGTARIWDTSGRQIAQYEGRGVVSPGWQRIATIVSPTPLEQASGAKGDLVKIWRIDDLDGLINRGCQELQYYLKQSPNLPDSTRRLCDNIGKSP